MAEICMMVHCGSRGLGHQVCTDHLQTLEKAVQKYRYFSRIATGLCPDHFPGGRAVLRAMAASANYAWANRQVITHQIRGSSSCCGIDEDEIRLV